MSRFWQRIKFALVIILLVNKKLGVAAYNEGKIANLIRPKIWLHKVNNIVSMTTGTNVVKPSSFQWSFLTHFSD